MVRDPLARSILLLLIVVALVLPVAMCVIWAVAELLGVMGDFAGRIVLKYIALGLGILWVVVLVLLVIVQAVRTINGPDGGDCE